MPLAAIRNAIGQNRHFLCGLDFCNTFLAKTKIKEKVERQLFVTKLSQDAEKQVKFIFSSTFANIFRSKTNNLTKPFIFSFHAFSLLPR